MPYPVSRLYASFFALVVALTGILIDALLIRAGLSRFDVLIVSNILTGGVAGVAWWLFAIREHEQRAADLERLRIVSEMNHHVRNALQVIVYYGSQMEDQSRGDMQRAIERIQWSLQTILPPVEAEENQPPRPRLH
jgi:hypothetical protein